MGSKPFEPFLLPNGTKLKNRIAKAAMQEKIADVPLHNQPSEPLINIYKKWGDGGSGLILSGHVMVDPLALAAPGDILLAEDAGQMDEQLWRRWIDTTQEKGAQFWFQLNHPGRQIMKGMGLPVYAPSEVAMEMGVMSKMFEPPKALTEDHINTIIQRFAWAAKKAEELGAAGVEIHAAHGYLLSQFLSPKTNRRTDQWGGTLENRARMLYEVIRAVRAAVSPRFGVGVKINTADFQRGGFAPEEFMEVVKNLNNMGLDMLELSGGSYESPVMMLGEAAAAEVTTSTAQREVWFLEAAKKVLTVGTMPIMVTGGISRLSTLNLVVDSSERFIAGVATAMGLVPDLPLRWEQGEDPAPVVGGSWVLSGRTLAAAKAAVVQYNIHQYGKGPKAWNGVWPVIAILASFIAEASQTKQYKRWIASYGGAGTAGTAGAAGKPPPGYRSTQISS